MDKWQFMGLDNIHINLDGASVNTRPILNEFVRNWLKVHDGERWSATNICELLSLFDKVCSSYGYSIELKREEDTMMVIVYAV